MGHKKLIRFAEIKTFPNVQEYPQDMPGKWNTFFKNDNPITLELACGKGEYTLGLASLHPNRNVMGVDIKGNRIWAGARKALSLGLPNAAFLRSQIEMIATYFIPGEVAEIWITFPDPQLRNSKAKKRLTHPRFLQQYHQFLVASGTVHLKTDSPNLYAFTKKVIELYGLPLFESSDNVYAEARVSDEVRIKTYYESLDIAGSNRIHYIKFGLHDQLVSVEKEEQLNDWINEQNPID